jgi:hypothetical protein
MKYSGLLHVSLNNSRGSAMEEGVQRIALGVLKCANLLELSISLGINLRSHNFIIVFNRV